MPPLLKGGARGFSNHLYHMVPKQPDTGSGSLSALSSAITMGRTLIIRCPAAGRREALSSGGAKCSSFVTPLLPHKKGAAAFKVYKWNRPQ